MAVKGQIDLAHMKSSKERVKVTDYVNITRLMLQLCSIICGTKSTLIRVCNLHSSSVGSVLHE